MIRKIKDFFNKVFTWDNLKEFIILWVVAFFLVVALEITGSLLGVGLSGASIFFIVIGYYVYKRKK